MSFYDLAMVWRHSPATGNALLVHLTLADMAIDGLVCASQGEIAILARCDVSTVSRRIADLIEIGEEGELALEDIAANYLQLGRDLQLDWLRAAITQLPRDNRWQSLARSALRDDLYRQHRSLTQRALSVSQDAGFVSQWLQQRAAEVEACQQMFAELQSFETLDLAMLSAGMRELNKGGRVPSTYGCTHASHG